MGTRWGAYHRGIDIARPSNYTIKAADNGVVTFAGRDGTYGNKVVINHNNGYETVYAHLSSINVSVGQVVATRVSNWCNGLNRYIQQVPIYILKFIKMVH